MADKKPYYKPTDKMKVTSDSAIGRKAMLTIGNQIIPVMGIDIRIRPDELITAEVTVRLDSVDVELLQEQTRIEVVKDYETVD